MADKNVFSDLIPADGDGKDNAFSDLIPKTSVPQRIGDVALSVGKGVVGAAEGVVGAADIATGGAVGKELEDAGYFKPKEIRHAIDEQMSEGGQRDAAAVANTKGFLPTVAEVAKRPWYLGNVVAESLPSMAAGIGVGRGAQALAPKLSAEAAGAIGEGVVSAGQTAEQIRQDTGTLDTKGVVGAVGSGAVVGLTGAIGNVAARAAKVAAPDTIGLLNRGLDRVEGNIAGRMAKSGAIESAEEVVQSAVEQIGQNYGTGKPLMEGVPEQAAIGGMAGGVMGAAGGIQGRRHAAADVADQRPEQNQPDASVPVGPLQAAATVGKASGAVQGAQGLAGAADAAQAPSAPPTNMGGMRGQIVTAAQRNGVDPRTALVIASIETGGRFNSDAANPKSSARGPFQFMDATRKMFPEVTPEMWQDPAVQAEYGAKFIAQTNARLQQSLGRAPTTGESYMGHLLGAYGASQLLSADPNTPVQDVVAQYDTKRAADIVRLNGMKGLTAGEAVAKWNGIADQHAQRLGVEESAFPFSTKDDAERRVRGQAAQGEQLEVVEHPTIPGKFAALPPMGGDPNEAQPASKVPLIADLPRYDEDPNQPKAAEAVQGQAQGQAAAPAGGELAVPLQQPQAAVGGAAQAAAVDPVTQQLAAAYGISVEEAQRRIQTGGGQPVQGVGGNGFVSDAALDGVRIRTPEDIRRDELISARGLTPGVDYNPNPTPGQAGAGNYKMVHESWNGLPLSIENPVGSTRTSKDPATPWSVDMQADYGYIKRTRAADSTAGKVDRVDFYRPMDADPSAPVWVIDQHEPSTGKFDEHKAILGVNSREEAELIYDQHFNDNSGPQRRAEVTQMSMPEFKAWLKGGNTDSMTAAEAAPQMRDAKAVEDGVLPPSIDFGQAAASAFSGVPEAAKFANDIQQAAQRPPAFNDEDAAHLTDLNAALAHAEFGQVSPLRSAPSPEHALVAAVAERAFGSKVVHLEPAEGFNGVAFKGRVYLAANETNPAAFTIGHEVAHTVEGQNVHAVLRDIFRTMGVDPKRQVSERQQLEQASDGRAISRGYAENEVIADMNGSMWVQPEFWKELAARDESVFRKVAYKFMELGTKALSVVRGSNVDASTIVRDVEAARSAIAQAWSDHLNSKRSAKASGALRMAKAMPPSLPAEEAKKNLDAYLAPSQVKEPMYHGTARDITRFQPKQAGAIFVAPKSQVADDFSEASENWKQKNYLRELKPEQIAAAKEQALADVQKAWEKGDLNDEALEIEKAIREDRAEENGMAMDYLGPRLNEQMPVGKNVMKLHVRATNPFDYENADHVRALMQKLESVRDSWGGPKYRNAEGYIKRGSWDTLEEKPVQAAIRELGHDGFYVYEGGQKNLGVYGQGQVKSATGNFGTFNPENGDIRFSKVPKVELPERVSAHLTPAERSRLRNDVAERLVALFDQLPSDKEIAAIAFAGRAARGWYKDSAKAISHVFGPDADRFTALLAAMSPQNSVQSNLQNAANTWANWIKAGRPTGRDEIIAIMGKSVIGNKLTDSVLDAWINNSVRALTSSNPESLVLSGPKVSSFMQNLRGNVQEVTNDSWMAAFAAVDQKIFGGRLNASATDPGKGSGYLAMSAKVRQAAQTLSSLTGDAWTPAEVQETVWAWAKTLYEMQDPAEGGLGAREIIDNGSLRHELVASTPEFSSLLLDEKYGNALRQSGYGQRIDDLRTLPSAGGKNVARAGSETRPFADSAQRGFERAVADRLERRRDRVASEKVSGRAAARELRNAGGVRGGGGRLAFSRGSDRGNGRALEGLPATVQVDGRAVTFGPFQPAHEAARAYMKSAGLPYNPPRTYAKVNVERAGRIASAFDAMMHDPQNPEVARAYAKMIEETKAQYEALMKTGLKVEFIDFEKTGDPYGNPRNAILDVVNNNHMWVFSTRDGFGTDASFDPKDNPLLAETGITISGKPALANDLFRVVHDYFGHIKDGVGFRADGEENAWRSHSAMYSPLARKAMTTETRGQNSWLNFGPYGESNRTAKTEDTHFADQKIGLLPSWVSEEGRTDESLKFSKNGRYLAGPNADYKHEAVFYSALQREMDKVNAKALPVIGWKQQLTALLNKGLVKKDEIAWTGIEEWLDAKGTAPAGQGELFEVAKIPKADVMRFLAANGVSVREVTLSGPDEAEKQAYIRETADSLYENWESEFADEVERAMRDFDQPYSAEEIDDPELIQALVENGEVEGLDWSEGDPLPEKLYGVFDVNSYHRGRQRPEWTYDDMGPADDKAVEMNDAAYQSAEEDYRSENSRSRDTFEEEAESMWDEEQGEGDQKFQTYSLPGGENYREVLLMLASPNEDGKFTSAHWDEKGVLAHVRLKDRFTDREGASWSGTGDKVLFVEEVQSDWAQEGRDKGFMSEGDPAEIEQAKHIELDARLNFEAAKRRRDELRASIRPLVDERNALEASWRDNPVPGAVNPANSKRLDEVNAEIDRLGDLLDAADDVYYKTHGAVSRAQEARLTAERGGGEVERAPFVDKTDKWVELALKRIIRMGVEQGYDKVAFATGQQNADRYDLAQDIERIDYRPSMDPGQDAPIKWEVVVRGNHNHRVLDKIMDAKELRATLGESITQRIISDQGDKPEGASGGFKFLSGDGLKMGGEGMISFYDTIVPNLLKKLLPKLGGEKALEKVTISYPKGTRDSSRGANVPHEHIAFPITDKMREAVIGGMPLFSKNLNPLKDVTVTSVKERVKGKWTDLRSLPLQALGGRQIAEVYGRDLPQLPVYEKLVQLMQAGVNAYAAKADEVVRAWGRLKDHKQLADLMHSATLRQIDPSKDYVTGDSESAYRELRAGWDKLTPEAKAIYKQARDMYEEHYAQVRQAIRERIERAEGLSTLKKSEMLTRMDGQFFERIKGVYFPLARFGDYVVVVRDEAGKVAGVSRAETKRAADTLRNDLKSQYGQGYTVSAVIKAADFNAKRDAVGSEFLEQLFSVLDKTGIGEDLQDDINQLVLSSMPDLSWAKHGIHRKGTAGFSQDARRAFAQNMFHGARYLQRVRFGDRLEGKLREAEKYVKGRNELTESVKEQQVLDEVRKRHELLMNPMTHPWSSAATSFGFFFHLGLSPASALVNLTQTPMVAFPILGGRFGLGRAGAALTQASIDTAGAKNDLSKSLKGDELAAIKKAIDDGVIDVTMAHDLAGVAQGNDSKLSWHLQPVMRAASWMFHHAERFNRQATFLAAYRMAKEGGASHEQAFDTASDLTMASHFDYSSSNRPRAMQGNVAKVALQFKQYSQNMTFTLGNNLRVALSSEFSGAERVQAAKTLGGLIVMAGAMAGAMGVPLVAQVLSLASMVGGSDDEPWDAKVALQNYLADTFGHKTAEVMMHGISRYGPADLSGRVSLDLGKMWFPDVNEALEGQKAYEQFAVGMLGPVFGGIGVNYAKAFQQLSEGKVQDAMESLAPSVVRGPLKALRYATEGAKTSDGLTIKDDVGAAGVGSQALGFRPSEVANAQEGRNAILSLEKRLDKRRGHLLDQFARAAMEGGDTGTPLADIQKWNETNPNRLIAGMHLQHAVATRIKRIQQGEQGVYLPPKKRDVLQEGRFAVEQ